MTSTMPSILHPVIALVALTAIVWLRLYQTRIGEMRRRRIAAQRLAQRIDTLNLLEDNRASGNFNNLLELPVLFYLAAVLALHFGITDALLLGLAWAFVVLRVAHSVIHCTYNRVMHRFSVYFLGAICLWALWARLIWLLW